MEIDYKTLLRSKCQSELKNRNEKSTKAQLIERKF